MRIGIASDHGGFALKNEIAAKLRSSGHEVFDFGAHALNLADDYPDFVIPLARALAAGEIERGVALCGSGVGASIAANKIPGIRAGLIHDVFSARQGVEDDDMNVFCLGGRVSDRRRSRAPARRDVSGRTIQRRRAASTSVGESSGGRRAGDGSLAGVTHKENFHD